MDIELSNSQKFSSSYQVVPGVLGARAAGMASTDRPYKDEEDLEGGPLVREHAASVEDSLRYRSRSSDYNGTGGGSPPLSASPAASGALPDDFLAINPGLDPTAQALENCEKLVLRPYRVFLKALGWTPISRDGDGYLYKIIRVFLVVFWLVVITTTFITQILSCFRRDRFLPGNLTNTSNFSFGNDIRVITCEMHIISSFILLDILLLASYLFGLYLFSRGETEYLSNLAEKVFIKNTVTKQGRWTNRSLIIAIGAMFASGVVWVFLSFAVRVMTSFSVEMWDSNTIIEWSNGVYFHSSGKIVLLVLSLIGFIFFDTIYVGAVFNYAAQSEMNIYLLRAIRRLITQKEYEDMDGAIKDILECRHYLRVLNGKTATATALILFNLGSSGIVAIINLNNISIRSPGISLADDALATTAAGLNVILWIGLVIFPFIQAARVTNACNKLIATGPEIRARPLQYVNMSQIDLDSYVTLTQAVRMRATMFGIPMYPWFIWAVVVAFTFTALILFQTNVYNFTRYL